MPVNQISEIESCSGSPDPYKLRARAQWSAHPCGAYVAEGFEFGTRQYFDAIERERYEVCSRWMPKSIRFDRYGGKRLIEVGCGTGTDLTQFARAGAHVTGVDFTPRSIEVTRRRFEVYGLAGQFTIGDAENLSFPDESFDVFYSFGVLHHTPDTERAVAEAHRVLRKGGRAIVMLYHRRSLYYWGALMFRQGLLRGDLFRESPAAMLSRYVEYPQTDARPLVKTYTRREARCLFRSFRDVRIEVSQLQRGELGALGRAMPETVFQWLERSFGWNLLITATK